MPEERDDDRLNRELIELLNELRVALPGVQVLFAFLLIVPFSQGFSSVSPQQRYVYFATLVCTGVSAALLIAPSSHHRLLWRQHVKEERLRAANRLAVGGWPSSPWRWSAPSSLSPTCCSVEWLRR